MPRPNIVVCLCDQMRAFELGCYGHPVVRTPALDALARDGVRFDVAVSNNPVCTPARSCLLSGQYSRTCAGYLGNEMDEAPAFTRPRFPTPTLAEALRDAGYHTALVGKWHVGAHPELLGFEDYVYPKFHHLNKNQLYFEKSGRAFTAPGYAEEFNQQMLGEALDRYSGDAQPFFIYYNIATPHMPFFDVPPEYQSMYGAEQARLRDNVFKNGEMAGNQTWMDGVGWFEVYLWDYLYYQGTIDVAAPEDFTLRDLYARYYGMVSYTDYHVGRMMEQLRQRGLAEDTLVVFTSDHGDLLGSHHLYNKDRLYEEAIRIPMMFHCPQTLAPRAVTTQVASLIDIAPTVLSLAGVETPAGMQGQDLTPVLTGETPALERNRAFVETTIGEIGVRTLTHLVGMQLERDQRRTVEGIPLSAPPRQVAEERHLHFDCQADTYQMRNLASTPDDTARDLRAAVTRWNAKTPWMEQPVQGVPRK